MENKIKAFPSINGPVHNDFETRENNKMYAFRKRLFNNKGVISNSLFKESYFLDPYYDNKATNSYLFSRARIKALSKKMSTVKVT